MEARCRARTRRLPRASPILVADPKNVGDLFLGNGAFAHVAESFVDGELFLDSDAKRLVELTASLKDVVLLELPHQLAGEVQQDVLVAQVVDVIRRAPVRRICEHDVVGV